MTVTYESESVVRTLPEVEVTWREDPDSRLKEKLDAPTVIEDTTALAPDTFRLIPPTLMTASVVSVASL